MDGTVICRRCLLKDMSDDEYFGSIRAFVDQILPDMRTPEATFEARLAACAACPSLLGGMCRLCGCFVEVRAAKRINRCPHPAPRWEAMEAQ